MKILYAKAFGKDLKTVTHNPPIKRRLLELIEKLKTAESLDGLHSL